MRVAWDLQAVTGPRPTGLGVSVNLLLSALQEHAPDLEVVGLRPNRRDAPLRSVTDRLLWEQFRYPLALRRAGRGGMLDLAYSPALGAPLYSPAPVVAHVHDLIALHYPAQFSGPAGWYWKKLLPYSWSCCRWLTVSNATVADDIAERLRFPRERISVVPYYPDPQTTLVAAASSSRTAAEMPPPQEEGRAGATPTFLTLASHEPRKNLELPVRALAVLKQRGVAARLRCIGMHTAHTPYLQALAAERGVADFIDMPDFLSRRDVVQALRDCTALLFASRYEGFGMPPLEAMSVGCAAVVSDIPCHRAVYSDPERQAQLPPESGPACEFVGVDDVEQLAAVMQRLIDAPAHLSVLRAAGLAYGRTFTPVATALALVHAFRCATAV